MSSLQFLSFHQVNYLSTLKLWIWHTLIDSLACDFTKWQTPCLKLYLEFLHLNISLPKRQLYPRLKLDLHHVWLPVVCLVVVGYCLWFHTFVIPTSTSLILSRCDFRKFSKELDPSINSDQFQLYGKALFYN